MTFAPWNGAVEGYTLPVSEFATTARVGLPRALLGRLGQLSRGFPVITLTGPRQSGKSTLCRLAFPLKPYANLESPDIRSEAIADPRGFLARFPEGAVLDEIQRAPELTSYLQPLIDAQPSPGRWILTGSQHGLLRDTVSQSLAGRNVPVELLPLAFAEAAVFPRAGEGSLDVWTTVLRGGFPPIWTRDVAPFDWANAYVATYLERDVREIRAIGDLHAFHTFLRLVAGRTAQLVELSALAADAGVPASTARAWLSVLEATYAVRLLQPALSNIRKRQVRARRLHMLDSGLACALIGIRNADELALHPARGAVFESFVHSEIAKWRDALRPDAHVGAFRDDHRNEIDLVVETASEVVLVEVKSGQTVQAEWGRALQRSARHFRSAAGRGTRLIVVYAGDRAATVDGVDFVPWNEVWRALGS